MPLPQVNDRLKEIPAQALRTVFATIGQLLLVADRLRARAASQLSGTGEATATRPADQAPAAAPPPPPATPRTPAKPRTPDAASSRWRSLDKTGNVRLLDGNEDQDAEELTRVADTAAEPSPAPVEYTPTEVVPAVSVPAETVPAEIVPPEIVPPEPDPAGLVGPAPAETALAEAPLEAELPAAPAEPALTQAPAQAALSQAAEPAHSRPRARPLPARRARPLPVGPAVGGELPVPSYDQLSVASLRARLRVLDPGQVQVLLDYEKAHEGRPAVITMFERRLTKLAEGN